MKLTDPGFMTREALKLLQQKIYSDDRSGDIQRQADEEGWLPHDGSECPIPWAKEKEYEVKGRNGQIILAMVPANNPIIWSHVFGAQNVIGYRLTDGWIPVVGEKCPTQIAEALAGEWEWKLKNGETYNPNIPANFMEWDRLNPNIVAVRLIKQPSMSEILDRSLLTSSSKIADGKLKVCSTLYDYQDTDRYIKIEPVGVKIAAKSLYPACKGTNCGCTDGHSHSIECRKEYAMAMAMAMATRMLDEFETLMTSAEAKKKALKDARALRNVVPPIGMAAMMGIAGKAMRDE